MEVDEQFEAADRIAAEFKGKQARAVDARYDRRTGRIVILMSSRVEVSFSPQDVEGLEGASFIGLDQIEISPSGYGIHFPRLDVNLPLLALLAGQLGSERWMAARQRSIRNQAEPGPRARKKTANLGTAVRQKEKWGGLRAIPGGLLASRSPERGNTEVEKDGDDQRGHQKHSVIRAVGPTRAHAPKVRRKSDDGEKEENSGDFEPNDSADAAKGSQEPTDTTGDASAGLVCDPADRPTYVPSMNLRVYSGLRRMHSGRLLAGRESLADNSSGDAYSDSQGTADGLWSHPIYDGSSDAG